MFSTIFFSDKKSTELQFLQSKQVGFNLGLKKTKTEREKMQFAFVILRSD